MSNYMGEHKVQLRTKTTFILSTTFFLSNSSVEHYIHTRPAIKDSYIYQQMQLEQPNYLQWNYSKHYPGPWGFYWCAREPRSGENESRSSGKGKTSGYLGLNSHFHSDASCQTHQIDNYKGTNSTLPIQAWGSDLDPSVCMKVRFKSKVTRDFSILAASQLVFALRGSRKKKFSYACRSSVVGLNGCKFTQHWKNEMLIQQW